MMIGIDSMYGDGGGKGTRGSKGDVGGMALESIGGEVLAYSRGSIVMPLICTTYSVQLWRQ